jgi:hypothetical protein
MVSDEHQPLMANGPIFERAPGVPDLDDDEDEDDIADAMADIPYVDDENSDDNSDYNPNEDDADSNGPDKEDNCNPDNITDYHEMPTIAVEDVEELDDNSASPDTDDDTLPNTDEDPGDIILNTGSGDTIEVKVHHEDQRTQRPVDRSKMS